VTALLFALALLSFWTFVGYGVATLLRTGQGGLQRVLLSPSLGMSTVLLPVFFLNRAGLPVSGIASDVAVVSTIASATILAIRRPWPPRRAIAAPAVILLCAAVASGWPMLRFGFDWISFSNDDMANYCLAAQRFLQHGYFDAPDLARFFNGENYSLAYWYMHVGAGARPGPELMLALIWGITGLNAHEIFMPTIVALHLALVAASGATVAGVRDYRKRRRAVCLTMLLMLVSPLSTLGVLYQLIAQVGGLALMMAALALLCRPARGTFNRELRDHAPIFLLGAGLLVWYPEITPFVVVSWVCWLAAATVIPSTRRMQTLTRDRALAIGAMLITLALIFNDYLVKIFHFMGGQVYQGLRKLDPSLLYFPFYLIPHGFGYFWGLLPIGHRVPEPFLSSAVVIGMALACVLVACVIRQTRFAFPPAIAVAVMLTVGSVLFYRSNDFGLYKLAMYMQPAVAAVIAFALVSSNAWRGSALGAAALCLLQAPGQFAYVRTSTGDGSGTMTEIQHGSQYALAHQFDALVRSLEGSRPGRYFSDSSNVVLAKIQALYSQGSSLIFPSKEYNWGGDRPRLAEIIRRNNYGAFWVASQQAHSRYAIEREINFAPNLSNRFTVPIGDASLTGRTLIANSPEFSIFNRYPTQPEPDLFGLQEHPSNHLIFVESSLGAHYYLAGERKKQVSFYQMEDDPLFPGRQMAGVGRHMLLLAIGASARPRMMIELTDTVLKQHGSALPTPVVYGQGNQAVPFIGRGSGRIVTGALDPIVVDGLTYFHLDMGRDGAQFPYPPTGPITGLFGRNVPLDSRYLTAFARNISLLTEDAAAALVAPSSISRFPADLATDGLQYSGFYEDGWISERAFAILQCTAQLPALVVRGMVPMIDKPDFQSTLTVRVDGQRMLEKRLVPGDFEARLSVPCGAAGTANRRIDLEFDRGQVLPGDDGRLTGGLISFIGFSRG
jgi:hypothetical protein